MAPRPPPAAISPGRTGHLGVLPNSGAASALVFCISARLGASGGAAPDSPTPPSIASPPPPKIIAPHYDSGWTPPRLRGMTVFSVCSPHRASLPVRLLPQFFLQTEAYCRPDIVHGYRGRTGHAILPHGFPGDIPVEVGGHLRAAPGLANPEQAALLILRHYVNFRVREHRLQITD